MRIAIVLCLFLFVAASAAGQGINLGPVPKLPPPEDNLGELFPVDGQPIAEEPDLTPFPESGPSLGEWESLEPAEAEIPDGTIIFQGPVEDPNWEPPQERIETHDGQRDYSNNNRGGPSSVVVVATIGLLLATIAAAIFIWKKRSKA